jgi:Ca2+-binding EF-hand superfamily protein
MRTVAACCLFLASAGAYADAPGAELFQALDLNGDGYVSISEAAGNEVVVTRFDRADKDRDGKLSHKEFANLKNVKVRVAKSKKDERSAATGASAKKRKDSSPDPRAAGG